MSTILAKDEQKEQTLSSKLDRGNQYGIIHEMQNKHWMIQTLILIVYGSYDTRLLCGNIMQKIDILETGNSLQCILFVAT